MIFKLKPHRFFANQFCIGITLTAHFGKKKLFFFKQETLKLFCKKTSLLGIQTPKNMISVTEKAKNKIIEIRQKEGYSDEHHIRVAVKGGGCSGLMYDLLFDASIQANDEVFEDKNIKILVDKKSLLYLLGTTLDFSDGLNGKGFQFVNPNASRTCGCGESFAV
ncbi:MAG: hypothetical protein OHK0045_25280 [Raineya sp.]